MVQFDRASVAHVFGKMIMRNSKRLIEVDSPLGAGIARVGA